MGWGKKTVGAKPQPTEESPFVEGPFESADARVVPMETAVAVSKAFAEVEAKVDPTDAARAQVEWHQLKSKKGWTDPTLVILLYEFIQSKGLFGDLVKFTRRR